MTPKLTGECPVCGDKKAGIRGLGDLCLYCCYEEGFDDVEEYRMKWAVRSGLPESYAEYWNHD